MKKGQPQPQPQTTTTNHKPQPSTTCLPLLCVVLAPVFCFLFLSFLSFDALVCCWACVVFTLCLSNCVAAVGFVIQVAWAFARAVGGGAAAGVFLPGHQRCPKDTAVGVVVLLCAGQSQNGSLCAFVCCRFGPALQEVVLIAMCCDGDAGTRYVAVRADIMTHIVNHNTHHRGQCS